MDNKRKKKGNWWLWLLVSISITVIGGWKWTEYTSTREAEQDQFRAQFQKEKSELALKLVAAKKVADESNGETERLRAEKSLLEAKLADCRPVPPTKRLVPRAKKVRASKPKPCAKVAEVKPKKTAEPRAIAIPQAPQGETIAQKLEKACGGRAVKFVDGKWQCAKTEPPAPVATRDGSFAKAVDEEVGVQATPVPAPQRVVYVAPVYEPLSRPNCMTEPFYDSDGRFYPAGFQHDRRSNGMCRCGSRGCDLRWSK